MEELVDHILYIANQNNKKITHLQLHKVAYFTFGYLIRENHLEKAKNMYKEENFQAWLYGPVLPEIYEKYKKYSSTVILSKGKKSEVLDRVSHVNQIILNLIKHDVFDLVDISHNHEFWRRNKQKILNNKRPNYNFESLRREFSR